MHVGFCDDDDDAFALRAWKGAGLVLSCYACDDPILRDLLVRASMRAGLGSIRGLPRLAVYSTVARRLTDTPPHYSSLLRMPGSLLLAPHQQHTATVFHPP